MWKPEGVALNVAEVVAAIVLLHVAGKNCDSGWNGKAPSPKVYRLILISSDAYSIRRLDVGLTEDYEEFSVKLIIIPLKGQVRGWFGSTRDPSNVSNNDKFADGEQGNRQSNCDHTVPPDRVVFPTQFLQ